ISSGYTIDSWAKNDSYGTLDTTTTANPTYTIGVGDGAVTITSKISCQNLDGSTYMQDFDTSKLCDASTTSGTLTDSRDSQEYTVAKLADSKWWMLDNLRLGSTSTIALTPANTNIASNFTLPASISSGFNSFTVAQINTASKDQTITSYGSGSGKIGVYYNYCAASAGTYCFATNSGVDVPDTIIDSPYDICPKGWRMPTNETSGEYQALYTAYSPNLTNFRNALSTPLSGRFDDSSTSHQGSGGFFWSSTYYNGNSMRHLYVTSSDVYTGYGNYRSNGNSVRCILK
ncbi:hypothetical protein IJG27_04290, partial [Candidatus Saccharibacteria bacterium]|nr:hypothetical protein [Candidatus Saccharibacteria bacterium]